MSRELARQDAAVANAQIVPDQAKVRLNRFWKEHAKHIQSVTIGASKANVEQIMATTFSALYRNPKLSECSPFSLLNGIVLGHQLGLTFGTPEVSLVPFGSEATLIIGYQGKAKLALGSGLITSIETENVLRTDEFRWQRTAAGLDFFHRPNWEDMGEVSEETLLGTYCQLATKGGGVQTRFCHVNEILLARKRSRGYNYQISKGKSDNPWITDFGAMALKTAIHRAMKTAPQDLRMALASAVDDEDAGGNPVIAEGLNPGDMTTQDLEPLVDAGAEHKQILESHGIQVFASWEDIPDVVDPALGLAIKVGGKNFTRTKTDQTWSKA